MRYYDPVDGFNVIPVSGLRSPVVVVGFTGWSDTGTVTQDTARRLIDAHNLMEGRIAALLDEKDVMLGAIGHDLKTPLAALTPATPTDPDAVRERLVRTRATGLAQTENTFEADVSSLAVPLFGSDGTCIGALAVAAPAMRMTPDLRARILPELLRAARDLVALWGGTIPADVAALWTNLTDTTERAAP